MYKHPPRDEVKQEGESETLSRRSFLNTVGAAAAGGLLVAAGGGLLSVTKEASASTDPTAPPLPWKYTKLDPSEAGNRGYKNYHEKGG